LFRVDRRVRPGLAQVDLLSASQGSPRCRPLPWPGLARLATLLEPTHWVHKFSVEFKSFSGRVRDVVRQSLQGPFGARVRGHMELS